MSKRQIIHFSDEAHQRLRDYVTAKYGKHRAISFVVQQAVEQFLEGEKGRRWQGREEEKDNKSRKDLLHTGLSGVTTR